MQRIETIESQKATGQLKELYDGINAKLGMIPNMMKTMGNSTVVLNSYLNFSDNLSKSSLGSKLGELIALTVANANGCEYCNAAHSFISEKLVGIDTSTIEAAKKGISDDAKTNAVLTFVNEVVAKRGRISNDDFEQIRQIGFSNTEITEIIAHVALNIFTNYFNNALSVDIDFPETSLVESVAL